MKTKGKYQVIKWMDKREKDKQIDRWQKEFPKESVGDLFPVFLKGIDMMRLNGSPQPDRGIVVFFAIKNLILTDVTMFGFDKSTMESEARDLLKFTLKLKEKLKLDTQQVYLNYEPRKETDELGRMYYRVEDDRLDGVPCHLSQPLILQGVAKNGKQNDRKVLVYPDGSLFLKEKGNRLQPLTIVQGTGQMNG